MFPFKHVNSSYSLGANIFDFHRWFLVHFQANISQNSCTVHVLCNFQFNSYYYSLKVLKEKELCEGVSAPLCPSLSTIKVIIKVYNIYVSLLKPRPKDNIHIIHPIVWLVILMAQ